MKIKSIYYIQQLLLYELRPSRICQ